MKPMKHASQWALLSAAVVVGIAYSCATPEDVVGCPPGAISSNCDVTLVAASEFEGADASVVAQGGGAGAGVNPSGSAGSGSNTPPPAGAAGSGTAGTSGSGAAGSGQSAGAGGSAGSGAAGSGAAGSAAAGTGGAAGAAGGGAAGAAGTGTGGTSAQSNFDAGSCNFNNRAGCESRACATACPANMGNYCQSSCEAIIACVAADAACVTAQDPMCGVPFQNPYRENSCTPEVNSAGNANTVGTPASVALALMNCLCDSTRL